MAVAKPRTPRKPTIEERVQALEKVAERLDRAHSALRRGHADTRSRLKHLELLVQEMPEKVAKKIEEATDAQTNVLKVELAQSETRQADRVTDVARQWPATAIVLVTLVGGAGLAFVGNLFAAATHLPHL